MSFKLFDLRKDNIPQHLDSSEFVFMDIVQDTIYSAIFTTMENSFSPGQNYPPLEMTDNLGGAFSVGDDDNTQIILPDTRNTDYYFSISMDLTLEGNLADNDKLFKITIHGLYPENNADADLASKTYDLSDHTVKKIYYNQIVALPTGVYSRTRIEFNNEYTDNIIISNFSFTISSLPPPQ
jgi:hypothetical protein